MPILAWSESHVVSEDQLSGQRPHLDHRHWPWSQYLYRMRRQASAGLTVLADAVL